MAFYTYAQNNSGGIYSSNKKLAQYVIIESANAYTANQYAEDLGIYFDGDGDCTCCGQRWESFNPSDSGTFYPEIHETIVDYTFKPDQPEENIKTVIVYFEDGRILEI